MASTFPSWIYDGSAIPDPFGYGDRAVRFLRALRHPASPEPRNRFQLDPWQERIVRRIYGPRHADGTRIVKEVWLQVPRGNRKTSIAAALALLHLLGPEKVPAGQVIFAASDRAQAAIGFTEAANIIRQDHRLIKATTIYDPHAGIKTIKSALDASTLKAVSSDGKAQHGTTPTFVLADEIHVWNGRELYEALSSGMVKRAGGLWITATTAGRGAEGLAAERYAYMRRIASGEIVNEAILPIIFEPETDDDWQDESTWFKVNPGLVHGYPVLSELRGKANEAKDNPAELSAFKQYNLNVWQANSRDPLIDFAIYDARQLDDDEADLEALPAYIGVDLSQTGDLTAVAIAFRHPDGQITLRNTCFVPGADLPRREHLDRAPYQRWADDGLIQLCPGNVIDLMQVEDHVRELAARYQVEEIAVDPALAKVLTQNLTDDGLPVFKHPQSAVVMSGATGELIRAANGGLIRHDGDPVLRSHLDNVAVSVNPQSGLVRMHKQRSNGKIDAAVASAMAVSRAVTAHDQKSRYDSPDVSGLFVF